MERLYKITGTGWFFHDFYVEATDSDHAYARAIDILCAENRAKSDFYKKKSAIDQIQNVKVVPMTAVEVIVIV